MKRRQLIVALGYATAFVFPADHSREGDPTIALDIDLGAE
jgi:hypothetical protein